MIDWGQLDLIGDSSGFQRPGHNHSETALCSLAATVGMGINV